jgi:hypothetical protein
MNQFKIQTLKVAGLQIHSGSSIQIPQNITNFSDLQPVVRLNTLNLHSASAFHVPSISINKCFHSGPKIVLSPTKMSIHRNSSNNRRLFYYKHIEKCNTKKCLCCKYLSCQSTIRSTVNGRVFSVNLASDVT